MDQSTDIVEKREAAPCTPDSCIVQPRHQGHLIVGLEWQGVQHLWSQLELGLRIGLEGHNEILPTDIYARAEAGMVQIWIVHNQMRNSIDGVVATELVEYSRFLALNILSFAGVRTTQWAYSFHDTLKNYAKLHGASRLEAVAPAGSRWLTTLKLVGFDDKYVMAIEDI